MGPIFLSIMKTHSSDLPSQTGPCLCVFEICVEAPPQIVHGLHSPQTTTKKTKGQTRISLGKRVNLEKWWKRELREISWLNCLLLNIVMKVSLCFLPRVFHIFGQTVSLKMWFWKFSCCPTQQMYCSYKQGQFHGIRILTIWRRYLNIMGKNLLISFKIIDLPIMIINLMGPQVPKISSIHEGVNPHKWHDFLIFIITPS